MAPDQTNSVGQTPAITYKYSIYTNVPGRLVVGLNKQLIYKQINIFVQNLSEFTKLPMLNNATKHLQDNVLSFRRNHGRETKTVLRLFAQILNF